MTTSDMSTLELDDNPIEVRISLDMVKRGIYVTLIIAVAAMPWGNPGALSAAFALGLVLSTFCWPLHSSRAPPKFLPH